MLWRLRVDVDTEHAVEEGLDAGQLVHVPRQVEPHAQKGVLHLPRRGAGWATCAVAGGWAPRGVTRLCHARLQGACNEVRTSVLLKAVLGAEAADEAELTGDLGKWEEHCASSSAACTRARRPG